MKEKERPGHQSIDTLLFKRYFYVYIATNPDHSSLVTGLSGSLSIILAQWEKGYGQESKDCTKLVYWERFMDVQDAIDRELKIRKMPFRKKAELVAQHNPGWLSFDEQNIHE